MILLEELIINKVDKTKEYDFSTAYDRLLEENIITSIDTKNSYRLDRFVGGKVKLKFYNPSISRWQNTDYCPFGFWMARNCEEIEVVECIQEENF